MYTNLKTNQWRIPRDFVTGVLFLAQLWQIDGTSDSCVSLPYISQLVFFKDSTSSEIDVRQSHPIHRITHSKHVLICHLKPQTVDGGRDQGQS